MQYDRDLHNDPVKVWTHLCKVINVAAVARECGVKPPSVHAWKQVPVHQVNTISKITLVPPSVLRPDVFANRKPDDFFRAIPLDMNIQDGEWGLERVNFPGIIVAQNMPQELANRWVRWLNEGVKLPSDLGDDYTT